MIEIGNQCSRSNANSTYGVMIVDDHDAVRRGIRCLIETEPRFHVVAEASNGRDALALALEVGPEIAIIEFSLPELNGLELARKLGEAMPHLRILLYTMHDDKELILEALRAGVRGFVLKSDTSAHLLAALDALSNDRPYFTAKASDALLGWFLENRRSSNNILTMREREVIQLFGEGRINKEVAHILQVSIKTVETHRSTIMRKLKLHNAASLVRYAVRNNIVQA